MWCGVVWSGDCVTEKTWENTIRLSYLCEKRRTIIFPNACNNNNKRQGLLGSLGPILRIYLKIRSRQIPNDPNKEKGKTAGGSKNNMLKSC